MLKGLEYLNNHISLNSNTDILEICKKFFLHKNIKINHVNYIQRNDDGTVFYLCSNQGWLMHYFKMGYPSIGAFENNETLENYKYVLWDSLDKGDKILIDSKEILNIEHGITVLDKLPTGIGFYNFGTNQHSSMPVSKYLNHLDDLHEFIFYFKEMALDLLLKSSDSRFILPSDAEEKKLIVYNDLSGLSKKDNSRKKYEAKLFVDTEEKIFLTTKENECVDWYFKGKTSSEIAIIMGISKRTVETHMEKIKHKLKCSNMFQLGHAIAKAKYHNFGFIPQSFTIEKY